MELRLSDPGWLAMRRLDDLVPDHGHLMHLFLVRFPALDEFAHLHPEQTSPGFFTAPLPALPQGATGSMRMSCMKAVSPKPPWEISSCPA